MTMLSSRKMADISLVLLFVLLLTLCRNGIAQDKLTMPKIGDPTRKILLDLLRPTVEIDAHQKVVFQVKQIHLLHGWAFLDVVPVQPNLKPLDRRKLHRDLEFTGDSVNALLHRVDGRWKLVDTILWPTDVGYPDWADKYHVPKELFVFRASK